MFQNQYINPIFYDDDYNMYSPFPRRQQYYNQRRAEEEARRRAALEYQYQQQQQQQAMLRRRLQEEEYRRRLLQQQQEKNRRQKEEEFYRQRLASAEKLADSDDEDDHGEPDPRYALVRGRDGMVYRVRLPTERSVNERENLSSIKYDEGRHARSEEKESDGNKAPEQTQKQGRSNQILISTNKPSTPKEVEKNVTPDSTRMSSRDEHPLFSSPLLSKKDMRKKEARSRVSNNILVEDASLSEYENDEYKSVWRNRRPAPGETWMEPVLAM